MSKKMLRSGLIVSLMVGVVLLAGCGQKESERLRKENLELKKKITKLEQDLSKLKETPEYYYQQGIDSFSAGNFEQARQLFQSVVDRYPNSQLVSVVQTKIKEVDKKLAEIAKAKQEEERKRGISVNLLDLLVEPSKYLNKRIVVLSCYSQHSLFATGEGFALYDCAPLSTSNIQVYMGNLPPEDRKAVLRFEHKKFTTVKGIWRQKRDGDYYLDAEEIQ